MNARERIAVLDFVAKYVVVAGTVGRGFTLYGPFDTVEAAHEWATAPYRAEETRAAYQVLPLFGGLLLDGVERRGVSVPDSPDILADGARRWTGVARP